MSSVTNVRFVDVSSVLTGEAMGFYSYRSAVIGSTRDAR